MASIPESLVGMEAADACIYGSAGQITEPRRSRVQSAHERTVAILPAVNGATMSTK